MRKLIQFSLKKRSPESNFTLTVFEIFLFEDRSVLTPQQSTGWERANGHFFKQIVTST